MNKFIINFFSIVMIGLLCGCATMYEPQEMIDDPDPTVRRLVSLYQIQKGLTQEEVRTVLGDQVVIGYEMPDTREQRYKPIVKENPQRVETITSNGTNYVIEYYFVGVNASDGSITDDELSPLVFKDDALVGWGWDFFKKIKQ